MASMPIGTKKNSVVLMLSTPCAYRLYVLIDSMCLSTLCAYRLHVPSGTVSRVCRPDQCCRRDLVAAAGHMVQVNQDVPAKQDVQVKQDVVALSVKCVCNSAAPSALWYGATN